MKILSYIVIVLALLIAGYAHAATAFDFSPAVDGSYNCPSYCFGYLTSDPAHSVDYVNVQAASPYGDYRITLSVDGVTHQGTSSGSGQSFTAGTLLANIVWSTTRTCTHSGRGQTCTTRNHAVSGSVATP